VLIYPDNFEEKTGFDRIRELVAGHCASNQGKAFVQEISFDRATESIREKLARVNEFKTILVNEPDFAVGPVPDLVTALEKFRVEGTFLEADELKNLRCAIDTAKGVLAFFNRQKKEQYPALNAMTVSIKLYPYITERINTVLNKNGKVRDNASRELLNIRQEMIHKQASVAKIMNRLMQQAQTDGLVDKDTVPAIRNGRPVIPVDAADKRRLKGIIHDQSATGKTIFIEPAELVGINNDLRELEYEEQREIIRILTQVTNDLRPYHQEIGNLYLFLGMIDFIRAKALFARDIHAGMPLLTGERMISWKKAVHPLLYLSHRREAREVVPLDITISREKRILVISGPNAGGKSVCLKTVGLLQYMLQCGLLIPVDEDSHAGIFEQLFIDIGDEQSIENDLSTYSSHLKNMRYFLKHAGPSTLLLIDEFGTGTEPLLGGAIAEAVLEHISRTGCSGVITTHYSNLKHFAASAEGIENAAMLFDSTRMKPLFRLEIGQPGSSFAFEIARSTGLPEEIIASATEKAGEGHRNFDRHLREIIRDKKYWESKRDKIRVSEKRLQQILEAYSKELESTEKERKKILGEARNQAEQLLADTNRKIENTIREIRENQAEKDKTKTVRRELAEFHEELDNKIIRTEQAVSRKIDDIRSEENKIRERRKMFGQLEKTVKEPKKKTDPAIRVGDYVIMKGQETPGEVVLVTGAKARVNFGFVSSTLDLKQLEKIDPEDYRQYFGPRKERGDYADWDLSSRRLHFSPQIDIRGQRVDEAVKTVLEFIDEAVMVEAREVRILHGKGDGILRQAIRQYLSTTGLVKNMHDEHVQMGGAGITVVHL
jgi:DNA mismatch repair protein MutS2